MKEIEKDTVQYYQQNMAAYGDGAQGVGWKNSAAQQVRFQQLAKLLGNEKSFSVNDLGCGTGYFFGFLQHHHFPVTAYRGYDVLPAMVTTAANKWRADSVAHFYHITAVADMAEEDYTVASGIFNLKYTVANEAWLQYLIQTIAGMNSKSRYGFAFNLLTKYSDKEYMQDHLYYGDPLFLFDYCKKNISKNVALLHDYGEYDFTIIVRK